LGSYVAAWVLCLLYGHMHVGAINIRVDSRRHVIPCSLNFRIEVIAEKVRNCSFLCIPFQPGGIEIGSDLLLLSLILLFKSRFPSRCEQRPVNIDTARRVGPYLTDQFMCRRNGFCPTFYSCTNVRQPIFGIKSDQFVLKLSLFCAPLQ